MQKVKNEMVAEYDLETNGQSKARGFLKNAIPFLGLIIVFLLFAFSTDGKFIAFGNLETVLEQSIIIMVAGVGVTFVMAHGNLDFSLGGELAICIIVAWAVGQVNPWLAVPAGVAAGIACSSLTAVIHNKFRVPAFVVGLCIMFLGRGIAQTAAQAKAMNTPASIGSLDTPVFYFAVIVIVFVAGYILFEYTKVGKYNKAIGSNEKAAFLSGIPVKKYKLIAFMITGTCLGIASFMSLVKNGGVSATSGQGLEVNVLIALVLGGVSLTGGTSVKLKSCIIGALIFLMLNNGLTLWGVNADLVNVIKAIVFLVCVYFSYDRSSNAIPV